MENLIAEQQWKIQQKSALVCLPMHYFKSSILIH